MGIIQLFKGLAAFAKMMKDLPKEIARQQEIYCNLSTDELAALSDEDLFVACKLRIDVIVDTCTDSAEAFARLNDHQKVVYALDYLEMEVNNGGLCQFFVNSSRVVAPYVSDYMALIGASEHKALFDGFISQHRIDLNDLSSFIIHRHRDYEAQTKRYPFDEYDDQFYTLPSLQEPLTAYIRQHLDEF